MRAGWSTDHFTDEVDGAHGIIGCWTYPVYVQDEVTAALGAQGTFLVGPRGLWRDTGATTGSDFVIDDGRYVSAQWPGGAWTFAATVTRLVSG